MENFIFLCSDTTPCQKYIDAGQKCISASTNLRQQANELCTLNVEGKCKRAGRNWIDEPQQCRVKVQLSFFALNKSTAKDNINVIT